MRDPRTFTLSDYTDGEIFQGSPFFGDSRIVRLHLYTDEFEVENPLGSKKSLHKLAAFYFTIGNFESNFKSQLRFIHLCILVKNKLLQRYSYRDILRPLIADLHTLNVHGLRLNASGQSVHVKCALATISADNLAAHSLAVFTCCFSSGRVCRFCMVKDLKFHVN